MLYKVSSKRSLSGKVRDWFDHHSNAWRRLLAAITVLTTVGAGITIVFQTLLQDTMPGEPELRIRVTASQQKLPDRFMDAARTARFTEALPVSKLRDLLQTIDSGDDITGDCSSKLKPVSEFVEAWTNLLVSFASMNVASATQAQALGNLAFGRIDRVSIEVSNRSPHTLTGVQFRVGGVMGLSAGQIRAPFLGRSAEVEASHQFENDLLADLGGQRFGFGTPPAPRFPAAVVLPALPDIPSGATLSLDVFGAIGTPDIELYSPLVQHQLELPDVDANSASANGYPSFSLLVFAVLGILSAILLVRGREVPPVDLFVEVARRLVLEGRRRDAIVFLREASGKAGFDLSILDDPVFTSLRDLKSFKQLREQDAAGSDQADGDSAAQSEEASNPDQ